MSNSLSIAVPSMGGHEEAVTTWQDTMSKPWPIIIYGQDSAGDENAGFLTKCDVAWRSTDATVIGYLHSDLYIHEHGWDTRVLDTFSDPHVAVVGFVGATGLAHEDTFKIPYDFRQLARSGVWSNLTDWEVHGARETGTKSVAVIDSCTVFVRRELLARSGGWPVDRYPNTSHCSDLWICCMARRHRLNVRLVGIAATHSSGGKGEAGTKWLDARGGDDQMHKRAHELIYDDFRDVLPIRI